MYIPAFPILGSPPSSDPGPEEERSSRHRAMRHPGHRDGHGERLGAGWDDPAAGARRTPGMGPGDDGGGDDGMGWG